MRVKSLIAGVALAAVAGCGGGEPHAVPDVVGNRLDVAKERLDDAGLGYETIGGGALGIVVDSNWNVCEQSPSPGRMATRVELVVARWCPERPPLVPDLVGVPVGAAERTPYARGIEPLVTWLDDAPPDKAIVCEQRPAAGARAVSVELEVAETCAV
jgi:beta-lactam-binding protein with PASTA domain